MIAHRPKDFDRISGNMLLRLEGRGLSSEQKASLIRFAKDAQLDSGVPWGAPKKVIADVLHLINDKRRRDGRPLMDEDCLRKALRALLKGMRKEPLAEELSDALSNLREVRLGVRKMPPLSEDLKKTA